MPLNEIEKKIIIGGYAKGDPRFGESLAEMILRENPAWIQESLGMYETFSDAAIKAAADAYAAEKSVIWDNLTKVRETAGDILSGDIRDKPSISSAIADMVKTTQSIGASNIERVSIDDLKPDPYESVRCHKDLHACFDVYGFKTGSLYVIGGYTGQGKSCFGLNLLEYPKDTDVKAVYYNMENGNTETYFRAQKFIGGIKRQFDVVSGPHKLNDILEDIRINGYKFVVIDQLSFLDINCKAQDLRIEYKKACQAMADTAREQGAVIILLAQLNRSYMARLAAAETDDEWRMIFGQLDDSAFAESSDITRPAAAAVIVSRRSGSYWVVNVKDRTGNARHISEYPTENGVAISKYVQM